MKTITVKNERYKISALGEEFDTLGFDHGWGNGYVLIPKGHILHGLDYNLIDVNVHGGLSYSRLVDENLIKAFELNEDNLGSWCVGFDTMHYSDNSQNWPEWKVEKETERLREQLMNYERKS